MGSGDIIVIVFVVAVLSEVCRGLNRVTNIPEKSLSFTHY